MTWQPIDTAPKNGEPVDLWLRHTPERSRFDGRVTDCFWSNGAWRRFDGIIGETVEVEQLEPLRDGGRWWASHWMPRPQPPTE